jgi:hypothetical protein
MKVELFGPGVGHQAWLGCDWLTTAMGQNILRG